MMVANYQTKKELKAAKGEKLNYTETSVFGPEYISNGTVVVVGPDAYKRKWFAKVTLQNDVITKVE